MQPALGYRPAHLGGPLSSLRVHPRHVRKTNCTRVSIGELPRFKPEVIAEVKKKVNARGVRKCKKMFEPSRLEVFLSVPPFLLITAILHIAPASKALGGRSEERIKDGMLLWSSQAGTYSNRVSRQRQ
jgi:hypothetical protein